MVAECHVDIRLANGLTERHDFPTPAEASARAAIIRESMTWMGTPFRDCADVKGGAGGVDCAMLLVRCYVDTGMLAPFDPRPYPPQWLLHQYRERFIEFLVTNLSAHEVDQPQLGDVILWRFGNTYAHGSILINSHEILHAYGVDGSVVVSRLEDDPLKYVSVKGLRFKRPVKYFSLWGR